MPPNDKFVEKSDPDENLNSLDALRLDGVPGGLFGLSLTGPLGRPQSLWNDYFAKALLDPKIKKKLDTLKIGKLDIPPIYLLAMAAVELLRSKQRGRPKGSVGKGSNGQGRFLEIEELISKVARDRNLQFDEILSDAVSVIMDAALRGDKWVPVRADISPQAVRKRLQRLHKQQEEERGRKRQAIASLLIETKADKNSE